MSEIERRRELFSKGGSGLLLPIGGRIFYDDGDNGAEYKFYDINNNEITDISISGLANAVSYKIKGEPTKDRFYAFNNDLRTSIYWGYYGTTTGITANAIGSGKTNTQTILDRGVPTDYTPNIWGYIKECRDNLLNGCDDWFIASMAEQDKLRASGLVSWYGSQRVWSSVEYSSNFAYYWYSNRSFWDNNYKRNGLCAFAARAF